MEHPLSGIRHKLQRAEENIRTLEREMSTFLAPLPIIEHGMHPIFTDADRKAWEKLQKVGDMRIPPRFTIIACEVIHHLRSSFDHLAWQLSNSAFRATPAGHQIEFPVFAARRKLCGLTKDKMCSYCRKVEGISSSTALARIESLQPYNSTNPLDDSLWLIHDLNRIDKHRELVFVVATVGANISGSGTIQAIRIEKRGQHSQIIPLVGTQQLDVKVKISARIVFPEFGAQQNQFVIPSLLQLLNFTRNVIESFAGDFV